MNGDDSARKPTSEPPDVDSLMSRLDGDGPSEERGPEAPISRPSAADLLGGRTRRSKRAIRVPDDAVPAASPPSPPRPRTIPPGASAPANTSSNAPPDVAEQLLHRSSFLPEAVAVRPQRIIAVGGPATPLEPPTPAEPANAAPVPTSEPTPFAPEIAVLAPAVFAPPVEPELEPLQDIEPEEELQPNEPTSDFAPTPVVPQVAPRRSMPPPPPVRTPTPFLSPFAPPPTPAAPTVSADAPKVTLPNLDAQVREALAMLDREDFEAGLDISVAVEEPVASSPPSVQEESLGDEELEVVEQPSAARRAQPAPPPRRQSLPAGAPTSSPSAPPPPQSTLPAAAGYEPTSQPTSQPTIVVAAAATATAAPAAAASIAAAPASTPTPTAPPVEPQEPRKKKRLWFEELFNDDFARTLPRADPKFLLREVSFIEDSLGCDKGATLLDLGCGPGEHSVALATRGYEVIGVDLSLAMLARASDEAAEKGQRINFLQGDMRDLAFDEAFDGIFCFNTTFGYFDDAKNAEVIQRIHRALRRGGRFLLDVANRDYIAPRSPSMVWFEGDGCVCMDDVVLNGLNSRLVVKRTMMMEDGRQREIEYQIRLYALHELGKLLHDNGFRVAEVSGDTSTPGSYFGAESPRILILAEKR